MCTSIKRAILQHKVYISGCVQVDKFVTLQTLSMFVLKFIQLIWSGWAIIKLHLMSHSIPSRRHQLCCLLPTNQDSTASYQCSHSVASQTECTLHTVSRLQSYNVISSISMYA